MLLESSLLIINIFSKRIYVLLTLLFFLLTFNCFGIKKFHKQIKKMGKLLFIYLFYYIFSIFFYKTGEVILSVGKVYITKEGLIDSTLTLIKLINFFIISFTISKKISSIKLKSLTRNRKILEIEKYYGEILENIFKMIPFIFELIRKRVKISNSYKRILLKVYRNL